MTLLALCCCVGALALAARDLRHARAATPGGGVHALGRLQRVAARYDRSRPGRRLANRLWRAQVHMSPAAWRFAQALALAPLATALAGFGMDAVPALVSASTAVRVVSALTLYLRRHASGAALDRVAPDLARALSTELAAWGSGGQAVTVAASRASAWSAGPMASHVLQAAAARVVLGGDASSSLHRAMLDSVPRLHPTAAAARVGAVFALHRHDSAATAQALDRLAAAVEAEAALRSDVSVAVAEVRMSAVAVPLLAAATLALLLATDHAALIAALSPPLLPLIGAAVLVVASMSIGVRRLVST